MIKLYQVDLSIASEEEILQVEAMIDKGIIVSRGLLIGASQDESEGDDER